MSAGVDFSGGGAGTGSAPFVHVHESSGGASPPPSKRARANAGGGSSSSSSSSSSNTPALVLHSGSSRVALFASCEDAAMMAKTATGGAAEWSYVTATGAAGTGGDAEGFALARAADSPAGGAHAKTSVIYDAPVLRTLLQKQVRRMMGGAAHATCAQLLSQLAHQQKGRNTDRKKLLERLVIIAGEDAGPAPGLAAVLFFHLSATRAAIGFGANDAAAVACCAAALCAEPLSATGCTATAAASNHSAPFECTECTRGNGGGRSECEICEAPRPAGDEGEALRAMLAPFIAGLQGRSRGDARFCQQLLCGRGECGAVGGGGGGIAGGSGGGVSASGRDGAAAGQQDVGSEKPEAGEVLPAMQPLQPECWVHQAIDHHTISEEQRNRRKIFYPKLKKAAGGSISDKAIDQLLKPHAFYNVRRGEAPTVDDALAKSVLDAWPGAVKQFFAPITQSSTLPLFFGKKCAR